MKQSKLISKKHKKVCKILNYTKHLVILTSTVVEFLIETLDVIQNLL